jgi:23S rRNA maturation-related 3'-5' exoribonuclease YhaM
MNTIQDKIQIIQMEINVESNPERKKEMQKQLQKLLLKKEIETIRRKIEQLG